VSNDDGETCQISHDGRRFTHRSETLSVRLDFSEYCGCVSGGSTCAAGCMVLDLYLRFFLYFRCSFDVFLAVSRLCSYACLLPCMA